jgi:hypothetical protein
LNIVEKLNEDLKEREDNFRKRKNSKRKAGKG